MRCDFLRDYRGSRAKAEDMLDRSAQTGIRWGIIYGTMWLGRIMVADGGADAGVGKLGEELSASEGWDAHLGERLAAEAYLKARRAVEGSSIVDKAIARVAAGGSGLFESDLHRLKGELALMAGDALEAEAAFNSAIAIARRQQAKSFELRASISLARLLAQRGRRDEARTTLSGIYNWFTEGFDTADLTDAKALLDELSN
jgi:predicted ATPase